MIYPTACCGVKEISGISENLDAEVNFALVCQDSKLINERGKGLKYGVATFTYHVGKLYGENFVQFLKDNKLGLIQESPEFENPNTLNILKMGFWIPDIDRCQKVLSELKKKNFDCWNGLKVGDKLKIRDEMRTSKFVGDYETYEGMQVITMPEKGNFWDAPEFEGRWERSIELPLHYKGVYEAKK